MAEHDLLKLVAAMQDRLVEQGRQSDERQRQSDERQRQAEEDRREQQRKTEEDRIAFMKAIANLVPLPGGDSPTDRRTVEGAQGLSPHSSDYGDVSSEVPNFVYEQNGSDTETWIDRVRGVFKSAKGQRIELPDRAAMIRSKLPDPVFKQLASAYKPKALEDATLDELLSLLKTHFGRNESIFLRRMRVWRVGWDSVEDLESLGARCNLAAQESDFASYSLEDYTALIFVNAIKESGNVAITKKLLERAQQHHIDRAASAEPASYPPLKLSQLIEFGKHIQLIEKDMKETTSPLVSTTTASVSPAGASPRSSIMTTMEIKLPTPKCHFCGDTHWHKDCPFIGKNCETCSKVGHRKGFCNSAKAFLLRRKPKAVVSETVTRGKNARKYVRPLINGVQVSLKHDSGSDWTLISRHNWERLGCPKLSSPATRALSASFSEIPIAGCFSATVEIAGKFGITDVYVSELGLNLFGNLAMEALDLWNTPIAAICDSITTDDDLTKQVKVEFPHLFSGKLGKCTVTKASVTLLDNKKPPFIRARPVPFGAREAVEGELKRLQELGIIERVTHAECAAPVVAVKKKDTEIRVTADFSTGLNRVIQLHHHPLPTPESIYAQLSGMDTFSILDISNAFLQIELDDEAKKLMVINTHLGLFQVNRMQPGVCTAPAVFQETMDKILAGTGAMAYLDDIIVPGRGKEDHDARLRVVLKALEDAGFTLRLDKCTLGQPSITYLGKIVDGNGTRPDPERLAVLRELPAPTDSTQLRSFLGAANWYGSFMPNLSDLRGPLDELTRKNINFDWTEKRNDAFIRMKKALHSSLALYHYDPHKPLVVAADASSYGCGAVLLHRESDNTLRPVMYASCSFNDAERNYAQVEREALALIFAVKKFHIYIYGRQFELQTDHKPLVTIFQNKSGVPVHTANRLRRYALTLLGYDFTIKYVDNANFAYADFVSRLIKTHVKPGAEDVVIAEIRQEEAEEWSMDDCMIAALSGTAISVQELERETSECDHLRKVIQFTRTNWPQRMKQIADGDAASYFPHRNALHVVGERLFHGDRPIIPPSLRQRIIEDLHDGHPGVSRMQALGRKQCFWPKMNAHIEAFVQRCNDCATNAKSPRKELLHPWPRPQEPWDRLHIDFAGPKDGNWYFVVVDAHSNWPEIHQMRTTTAEKTVEALEKMFETWGPCKTIVSDNGPQFTSGHFTDFCAKWGLTHITSAPYSPQSNGRAEKFVDTLKRGLDKLGRIGGVEKRLSTLLYNYRRTPSTALGGKTPFELMTGRQMPSRLDVLKKRSTSHQGLSANQEAMARQFDRHHGARGRSFEAGQAIWYQYHQGTTWSWQPAEVTQRVGEAVYWIKVAGRTVKAHANQIKIRFDSAVLPLEPTDKSDYDSRWNPPAVPLSSRADGEQEDDGQVNDNGDAEDLDSSQYSDAADMPSAEPVAHTARPVRATAGRPPAYLSDNYILETFAEVLHS